MSRKHRMGSVLTAHQDFHGVECAGRPAGSHARVHASRWHAAHDYRERRIDAPLDAFTTPPARATLGPGPVSRKFVLLVHAVRPYRSCILLYRLTLPRYSSTDPRARHLPHPALSGALRTVTQLLSTDRYGSVVSYEQNNRTKHSPD